MAELPVELFQGLKPIVSETFVYSPPTVPEGGFPPFARLKGSFIAKQERQKGTCLQENEKNFINVIVFEFFADLSQGFVDVVFDVAVAGL